MSWFGRPQVWFPLVLLALAGGGAYVLATPECTDATARDLRFYWMRHYWQCAFDATSAACGAGLLTYDLDRAYTPRGRWALTAIGLVGAVVFVAAATQGWRRLALANGWPLPLHPFAVVLIFFGLQVVAVVIVGSVEGAAQVRPGDAAGGVEGAVWRGVAAGSSLGVISSKPAGAGAWPYALLGVLAPAVCAIGVVTAGSPGRVGVRGFYVLTRLAGYAGFLLVVSAALMLLEAPRGTTVREPGAPPAALAEALPRYGQALLRTTAAAGAGFAPTPIGDRGMSEGGKAVLALTVLVGGVAGGPTAGVSWALLLAALGGVGFLAGRRRIGALDAPWVRTALAGSAAVIVTLGLTLLVALGLLVIEAHTASRFQSPPTFADAFLDAASAVGGAGLTSGVTATVTGKNLTMGIRQDRDLFQYGMGFLIAAMWLGRWLPLLALGWAAGHPHPARPGAT